MLTKKNDIFCFSVTWSSAWDRRRNRYASASVSGSSYLLIDDLQVIYPSSGISEQKIAEPFLLVTNEKLIIETDTEEYINQWFYLIDIKGQIILSKKLDNNQVDLPEKLPAGVYVAVLKGNSRQYSQKVTIR